MLLLVLSPVGFLLAIRHLGGIPWGGGGVKERGDRLRGDREGGRERGDRERGDRDG